jgi:transcriptional regulator with XRE-family HTH domain
MMKSNEFRDALRKLKLTQQQAANAFGLSIRAVNGYCNGTPVPGPTALMLRLMVRFRPKPADLAEPTKAARAAASTKSGRKRTAAHKSGSARKRAA